MGFLKKSLRKPFRRGGVFNRDVRKSIKDEIEQLENVGRVTASDQREVHAGFGFSEMKRDEEKVATARRSLAVSENLDDAFERLKSRSPAE